MANLRAQNYPNYRIIIVDDHSEDSTAEIIQTAESSIFTTLKNQGTGKKAALLTALDEAPDYKYYLFTDADCIHGPEWIASMMKSHLQNQVHMTVGGVIGTNVSLGRSQKYHDLELWAWLTVTGAAVSSQIHPMANGANMLLNKSMLEVEDPFAETKSSSGDDMFSAERAFEHSSLHFCLDPGSVIRTYGPSSFSALAMQKRRWASKNHLITNKAFKKSIAHLSYLYIAIGLCAIMALFNWWAVGLLILTLFIKNQFDVQLMRTSASELGTNVSWTEVLLTQPLNILLTWQSIWPKWDWKSRPLGR